MASGGINTDILSDETFDLLCTVCKRKGRNREAEHFCIDCQDYYCSACVKVHDDIPLLIGHKILDKGQFPLRSSQRRPAQPGGQGSSPAIHLTERCDRHSHYFIDTYCQNHDTVGCATCMTVDHRLCQDVFYVPEFVKSNASVSPNEIQKKLQSTDKALTELIENFQRQKQELLKGKADSLQNIRKFRKEINERLDALEKKSIDEIESKLKTLTNEIEKAMSKLQKIGTNVSSARDKLASAGKNLSQTFVYAKRGRQIADDADKSVDEEKAQRREQTVEFTGDQKLISLLEQMTALGGITCTSAGNTQQKVVGKIKNIHQQDPIRPVTKKENNASGKLNQKDTLLQTRGKNVYSVKIQSDTSDCSIKSACTLEDGTIILSDGDNKKLKRLDSTTYTVTDYCDLPGTPWQVCIIDKQEVAVCLYDKKDIHIISLLGRMRTTRKINTDFECYGLAYAKGNLYISDPGNSVYIYSISGQKLKQFSKDQSGQSLFSNIRHLAVSEDGSMIYVVDWDKGLIVLDSNGDVVSTFNGPQLDGGSACYLTRTGSLLVSGFGSHNVLQFGHNGELIGEVHKSDQSVYYEAVYCDQQMSKLILGSESNNLEIYDLK
ncbi:uncharacterized protein LOC123553148 [Mercenaria mercenaria]|uniref:uncharacterized protein LOC123553148 n=1 Tax=Mercenaria mercenaria TaxID=6596 RepID=UPI00234E7206|nr:uncharacterized protein LOC123553148 [Mercenaria mercenaria]